MKKTHIIVHHSLVSRDDNPRQFTAIEKYHRGLGWGEKTGYNFIIEPDGVIENGRPLNQPGAHTRQHEMNYKSIGICLSGNFDIEEPTDAQIKALHTLIIAMQEEFEIPDQNVVPHRYFANYKSCWGWKMPDNILDYLEKRMNPYYSKNIRDNEEMFEQFMNEAHEKLHEANSRIKYLSELKGIEYRPFEINRKPPA